MSAWLGTRSHLLGNLDLHGLAEGNGHAKRLALERLAQLRLRLGPLMSARNGGCELTFSRRAWRGLALPAATLWAADDGP